MDYILKRPFYTKYAWVYDKIIERPVKSDCDFIEKKITQKISKKQISVLDAGCGTGNYSIELATRGFDVTGVDISKEQILTAQSKIKGRDLSVKFLQRDLFDLQLDNSFDVIICRGVLNDIIENKLRKNIFSIFKSYLNENGLLVFDVRDWNKSFEAKKKNPVFEKTIKLEAGELFFSSTTKFNESLKQLLITEKHILKSDGLSEMDEYDFIMQCWTIDELKNNLTNAGFREFEYYGAYNYDVKLGATEKIIVTASA